MNDVYTASVGIEKKWWQSEEFKGDPFMISQPTGLGYEIESPRWPLMDVWRVGMLGPTEGGVCWEEEEFHLELCTVQSPGSTRTPMSKFSAYWANFWWTSLLIEADDFRVSLLKLAYRGKWAQLLFLSDGIHVLPCAGKFAHVLLKLTTYTLTMLKINLLTLALSKIMGWRLEEDFD